VNLVSEARRGPQSQAMSQARIAAGAGCEACPLRRTAICSSLSDDELSTLTRRWGRRAFAPGSTLIEQGQPSTSEWLVVSGMVMRTRVLEDGRRSIIDFLFQGDFIPAAAGDEYNFGVSAIGPVIACRWPREVFERVVEQSDRLNGALVVRTAEALAVTHDHVVAMAAGNALERVADFLRMLNLRQQGLGGVADLISVPMTRQNIAEYLGLTLETVSRAITALRQDGAIELVTSSLMRVVDRNALLAACNGI
jgi:CRP/FNR family transcriptional regulator, anaerobic regulatory protein